MGKSDSKRIDKVHSKATPSSALGTIISSQDRFFIEIHPSIARLLRLQQGDLLAENVTNDGILLTPCGQASGNGQEKGADPAQ